MRIRDRRPEDVFRDWVEPERLREWWPPEARLDPRVDGSYEFAWPRMGWTLRGIFREFVPGRRLRFTWTWDHEPDVTKEVGVVFRAAGDSATDVEVEHGPYGDGARDAELRGEHLAGWQHFLGRLAGISAP